MKWLSKLWSAPDPLIRTPGQTALVQAWRITDHPDIGKVIGNASIDDLEWLLQSVELQMEETPHWVTDPKVVATHQAWNRRVRSLGSSALHNKRVRRRLWSSVLGIAGAIGLVVLGVLLEKAFG